MLARDNEGDYELDDMERRWEATAGSELAARASFRFPAYALEQSREFCQTVRVVQDDTQPDQHSRKVFLLLRNMDEDIDTYLALTQPEGSQWPPRWRQCAQELRMFSVRQPFPMLMAARRNLQDADFESLLSATVVLAFRYNVIGAQHTGEQERAYHSMALRIARAEVRKASEVLEGLRLIYLADEPFRSSFYRLEHIKTTATRNNKVVRYILCKLERFSIDAATNCRFRFFLRALHGRAHLDWALG